VPESRTKKRSSRSEPEAEAPPAAAGHDDGARALVCNVAFCPICMAVTAAQGAAPDAVEHLLLAAREFFLAARAVVDVRADHLDGQGRSGRARIEKIEIG
jgi:hypothetical protein